MQYNNEEIIKVCGDKQLPLFRIHINNECNLNCEYCSAKEIMKNKGKPLNLLKVLKTIKEINKRMKFNIVLTGGEPTKNLNTLNYLTKELLKYDNLNNIEVITNGFKLLTYLGLFKNNSDFIEKVNISYSYHPSQINLNNYLNIFKKSFILINNLNIKSDILLYPKYFDNIKKLIIEMKNYKFKYGFIFINNYFDNEPIEYSEADYRFINNLEEEDNYLKCNYYSKNNKYVLSMSEIQRNELRNFAGFKCSINKFSIISNGSIIRDCVHLPTSINNLNDSILCPGDCVCDTDLYYLKEKI